MARPTTTSYPEAHRFDDYKVGENRSCRRRYGGGSRASDCHTALPEHCADHFNQFAESKGRFGRRLIYGGHVISLARALSFNGLGNAFQVAAINGGRHVAPLFAGCTVFAWSEILESAALPGRKDIGTLRVRTVATKDRPCTDFPLKSGDDYDPAVAPRSRLLGTHAAVSKERRKHAKRTRPGAWNRVRRTPAC
jgi:2-methylfumaryl-CoA hydratase